MFLNRIYQINVSSWYKWVDITIQSKLINVQCTMSTSDPRATKKEENKKERFKRKVRHRIFEPLLPQDEFSEEKSKIMNSWKWLACQILETGYLEWISWLSVNVLTIAFLMKILSEWKKSRDTRQRFAVLNKLQERSKLIRLLPEDNGCARWNLFYLRDQH